jgi:ABC-2 type transport system permease protein
MSHTGLSAAESHELVGEASRLAPSEAPRPSFWLAATALWLREIRGFYRQKARVAAGIATPLIFWAILGSGFGSSIQASTGGGYAEFFFPGTVVLVVLFTSIFSSISIIEDRREGFLLSVLAAPVPRSAAVMGKIAGATTIGAIQGAVFLPLIPLLGLPIPFAALPGAAAMILAMAFGLTSLGFFFAWRLDSTQGFHSVMNMLLMPMWLLSGAFFPADGASAWILWLMRINPLTYGVSGLRHLLFPGQEAAGPSLEVCWAVTLLFGAVCFAFAARQAARPSPSALS